MRIGICFSGGGFRATLFHCGVLRYLAHCKMLDDLKFVVGVSGGALNALHLKSQWQNYMSAPDAAMKELIDFALYSDARGRVGRRLPKLIATRSSPLTQLEIEYRKLFSSPLASAGSPDTFVLSTDLTLPVSGIVAFGKDVLIQRDGQMKSIGTCRLAASERAAYSSAFPALFPPSEVSARDLVQVPHDSAPSSLILTDGGVHDNLGVRFADAYLSTKADADLDFVIISDAGSAIIPKYRFRRPSQWLMRTYEVSASRVAELDGRELIEGSHLKSANVFFCHVPLLPRRTSELAPYEGQHSLTAKVQQAAAQIRTDLDSFSETEASTLVYQGWVAAESQLHAEAKRAKRSPVTRSQLAQFISKFESNDIASPPSSIGTLNLTAMMTCGRLDSNEAIERRLIDNLEKGAERKLRLWSSRDPVSWIVVSILALTLALLFGVLSYERESSWDRIRRTGQLRVAYATSPVSKGFYQTGNNGDGQVGLEPAVVSKIRDLMKSRMNSDGLGLEHDIVVVPQYPEWPRLFETIRRRESDLVVSMITVTPDRCEKYGLQFSAPYYFPVKQILARPKTAGEDLVLRA